MTHQNIEELSHILYNVGCYMRSYQTDILIDLPKIIESLDEGNTETLLFAKSHFDRIQRFSYDKEKDPIEECQKTLGANYKLIIWLTTENKLQYGIECLKPGEEESDFETEKDLRKLF